MTTKVTLGSPSGCQLTVVGKWNGNEVKAATDSMGAQVIVIGPKCHLLSMPFKNHDAAVTAAKKVAKNGPDSIKEVRWINLRRESFADSLTRLALGLVQ